MRQNDKKLFLIQNNLVTMLNLRRNGTTLETLAFMYNCDHKSIHNQCERYGVKPEEKPIGFELIIENILQKDQWENLEGERVNKGKTYAEYFRNQYPHHKSKNYW